MSDLTFKAPTLLKAWHDLNWEFATGAELDGYMVTGVNLGSSRSFSCVTTDVELIGEDGFGLEPTHYIVSVDRRVKLLRGRYIDELLWGEAMRRWTARSSTLAKGAPLSFTFPFYRAAENAPAGGGCLIALSFVWFMGKWSIRVINRASEVTYRLMGDMHFVKAMIGEILAEHRPRSFVEPVPIRWTLQLASQMSHVVPYWLLKEFGDDFVARFMTQPHPHSIRGEEVRRLFWKETINPEKVTWAQRRRWSDKFWEDSVITRDAYLAMGEPFMKVP